MGTKFDKVRRRVDAKKTRLLTMAMSGARRPCQVDKNPRLKPLGSSLTNYLCASDPAYDEAFAKKIREVRPDWVGHVWSVERKQELIEELSEFLEDGMPRPKESTDLVHARALSRYTTKHRSHDAEFNGTARLDRPDWFVTPQERRARRMEKILEAARRGDPAPSEVGAERRRILRYMRDDLEFATQLRKINPTWIITANESYQLKREEVIRMAQQGADRPKKNTRLGTYIRHQLSDHLEFRNEIRKVRPDWLQK